MTQQLSILELAKQGDATAIAALINRSLQPKGIVAQASLDRHSLSIVLLSTQIPNQKSVVELIHRGMMILQVELVKQVRISARKVDTNVLVWETEFELVAFEPTLSQTLAPTSLAAPVEALPTLLKQNLTDRNQKGVILIQKLSELNRNQQEYEDIIIRFTDDRSGAVRCLSTLAELMQVINKSNFSFSTVATNPTLRNLLDTIAESSITDEKGDQVIGNVSVLQPGQPWQKVKIRLVTQVYFEPDVYEPIATSRHGGITVDVKEAPVNSQIMPLPTASSTLENLDQTVEAPASNEPELDKTPESLLDDLIRDLTSTSIRDSKQTNELSERNDLESTLTVGAFLDDFGSESKPVAKSKGSSPSNLETSLDNQIDLSIDDLFDEFEFLSNPKKDVNVKKDVSINKASKSETDSINYPSPPQIDPYKKEVITLDDFF